MAEMKSSAPKPKTGTGSTVYPNNGGSPIVKEHSKPGPDLAQYETGTGDDHAAK